MFKPVIVASLLWLPVLSSCQQSAAPPDDGTSPAKGLWQGREIDATHQQQRHAEAVVLPSGIWMMASFGAAHDRLADRPAQLSFGVLAAGERQLSGEGAGYDASFRRVQHALHGTYEPGAELSLNYLSQQPGEPLQVLQEGRLRLQASSTYRQGGSAALLAGDYRNAELSLRIGADGWASGISGGGQAGYCNFTGVLGAEDERYNAYWGVLDLGDDPGCETGGASPDTRQFEAVAYLIEDRACERVGGQTQALVLGFHNGRVAHYYHRLCRI